MPRAGTLRPIKRQAAMRIRGCSSSSRPCPRRLPLGSGTLRGSCLALGRLWACTPWVLPFPDGYELELLDQHLVCEVFHVLPSDNHRFDEPSLPYWKRSHRFARRRPVFGQQRQVFGFGVSLVYSNCASFRLLIKTVGADAFDGGPTSA
jgi:hypothetical protein